MAPTLRSQGVCAPLAVRGSHAAWIIIICIGVMGWGVGEVMAESLNGGENVRDILNTFHSDTEGQTQQQM